MKTAILEIVGTVHCSQVFVQNCGTGLALAVVTGAPSGSRTIVTFVVVSLVALVLIVIVVVL